MTKENKKKNKKDEVKEEKLPQSYKSDTFEEPSSITQQIEEPWNPLGPKEEDEEEPCEDCLDEATKGSFVEDTEDIKAKEEALKQELEKRRAEHTYEATRDAMVINTLILIARRLGGIEHIQKRRLKLDEEYLQLVRKRMKITKEPDNPYNQSKLYQLLPEEVRHNLIIDYKDDEVQIRPKQWLGTENWSKVMAVVKQLDGDWNKKGKNSYWSVPR